MNIKKALPIQWSSYYHFQAQEILNIMLSTDQSMAVNPRVYQTAHTQLMLRMEVFYWLAFDRIHNPIMVNQIEAPRKLTMGSQIFIQFVIFILSLIAGYVLLNQDIRIHSMDGRVWNAVHLNFERLVSSWKPPWKPPYKINLTGRSWFKLVVMLLYLHLVSRNQRDLSSSLLGATASPSLIQAPLLVLML